jgi:hypothetical protein
MTGTPVFYISSFSPESENECYGLAGLLACLLLNTFPPFDPAVV